MQQTKHAHKWQGLNVDKLICHGCDTVSEISDVLANVASEAAHQSKISTLSAQLFARELRKDAHDKYYAWVRQNNSEAVLEREYAQEALL